MNRVVTAAIVVTAVAVLATSCTKVLDGKPVSVSADPTQIAGKPVTDEPSGPLPNAPGPTRQAENGDGGEMDRLALMAVADVEEFWTANYGPPLKGKFKPVNALFSYDSRYKQGMFCSRETYNDVNAYWCGGGRKCTSALEPVCSSFKNNIAWDRGGLLPFVRSNFGAMGIVLVLAHEYGHAIQYTMADSIHESDRNVGRLVAEQQADCFAGVYLHWVTDGKSPRFTLGMGDGLTKVLQAMLAIRDALLSESDPDLPENIHGSAFERISAFQFGFRDGASACASINGDEIERRRVRLPGDFLNKGESGETLVNDASVKALTDVLVTMYSPAAPPKVSYDQPSCPDARPTPPASYCPSTNTITIDKDRLLLMGTSLTRGSPVVDQFSAPLFGDYSAFSTVVSRFILAVQHQRGGLKLDNTDAGLRTACLTGAATTKLTTQTAIKLTGGDLDEAMAGLLNNGLVASNINGESAPVAFARADAFRTGVLGDEKNCYERWP